MDAAFVGWINLGKRTEVGVIARCSPTEKLTRDRLRN